MCTQSYSELWRFLKISILHAECHGHTLFCALKELSVLWTYETSSKLIRFEEEEKNNKREKMKKKKKCHPPWLSSEWFAVMFREAKVLWFGVNVKSWTF